MKSAFIKTLCEVAKMNERIWMLTGDLGYSVLELFMEQFPERYVNVGVAEQNMTGMAAGLASCGKIVFTYSIANFPTIRCLEQIRNDVCYHELPVKIIAVGGGFAYGPHGYTHHGVEDLAVINSFPGISIISPGNVTETILATQAIINTPGPCYLRLGRAGDTPYYPPSPPFAIGKAIKVREGNDLTLISTGSILPYVMDVALKLSAQHRIEARVLSMHTLKPLDLEAIHSAAKDTGAIITVEDHSITNGLGSAVASVLAEVDALHRPFRRFGFPDMVNHRVGKSTYMMEIAGDLMALVMQILGCSK